MGASALIEIRRADAGLSRAQKWALIRARAERLLVRFNPYHEPAGSPEGGRFTTGGGGGDGGSSEKPTGGEKPVALDPQVIAVGGDEWNKATARRLEREYQEAKPDMERIVGESATGGAPETGGEDEAPPKPTSWDELSDGDQEDAKTHYVENNESSYYDNEVQSWYDNGDAADEQKAKVVADFNNGTNTDWAEEAIKDYMEQSAEEGTRIPYTPEQILASLGMHYEAGSGYSDHMPNFGYDYKLLQDPIGKPEAPDPNQMTLPGIEPAPEPDYSTYLTEEMRDGLNAALEKAFAKEADSVSVDPPEYLHDQAEEFLEEDWDNNMTDDQKFEYVENHMSILEGYDSGDSSDDISVDALPKNYDPLNETSGTDYKRTQKLAAYLSLARTANVLKARGLPVPSAGTLRSIDKQLWSAWKSSSTSENGKLLQVATADELGGRLKQRTAVLIDPEAMREYADRQFKSIGGYAGVKAYVRAKWETTQYLLDKAGIKDLELYRGIKLDSDVIAKMRVKHMGSAVKIEDYTHLPTLGVERNGAASTSVSSAVSNSWGDSSSRIVLRALVPRTAALSVPAYGINVHSEKEVVIAGTAWKGWDAWKDRAPPFSEVPLKVAA